MPTISLNTATPVLTARAEQFQKAIVTAAEVKVDLNNDCLIKNWLGENAI